MKDKLIQLLELCIEKGLNYEYSPKHGHLNILEFDKKSDIIFECKTYSLYSMHVELVLNDLIEKVKNYKK